ncbi:hypothetical protein FJ977_04880 [Mesorhizobium sp. B2-1-3A]|nr:hypothetical protein FJ977_04880 [Mesorhizobium sp. B2-1-3A]
MSRRSGSRGDLRLRPSRADAPLCPAGHLPTRGEIGVIVAFANQLRCKGSAAPKLLISPQVGEMSGRT